MLGGNQSEVEAAVWPSRLVVRRGTVHGCTHAGIPVRLSAVILNYTSVRGIMADIPSVISKESTKRSSSRTRANASCRGDTTSNMILWGPDY